MNATDLERLVDRELKALPAPRAPITLLPRVLAAAADRGRVPWRWPRARHAAAAAALLAIAAGGALVVYGPAGVPDAAWRAGRGMLAWVAAAASFVRQASALTRLVWQLLFEPVAIYLLVLTLSFSLACAGLWTALNRVALGGASRQ